MIPYLQTTSFTCASSSLLTVLHHFNPEIKLNKENEYDIWRKTALLPTRGTSLFALALYAQKLGFKPKVIVENTKYEFPDYRFYRYTKEEVEEAAFMSDIYLKDAEKEGINIEVKEIDLAMIKEEIDDNNLLIIRVNAKPIRNEKRNTSNYIIVTDRRNGYFQIIDPKLGALSIPENIFIEAFETLETKKYRHHRMIIFPN
ncbi:MAG: peptidase C39 family protein [archaeon]|nr:peptidase C39 family protein [Nanoarchaeota archaeon]